MTQWTIPRESVELVGPITVTDNDTTVTAYEVAVAPRWGRPLETDWAAPDQVDGQRWVLVGPGTTRDLAPGTWRLWVRYTSIPETPVIDNAGDIRVT